MTIKLIVGLANPGMRYTSTRHNAGAWYIHQLANQLNIHLHKESKLFSFISCISLAGKNVLLLVPATFVNLSGKAVITAATFYHINLNEILIAHDEMDLPPGVAKFKFGGSHNGHNGLKDIITKFGGNSNFHRLRIGIGHPKWKNQIVDFVLGTPSNSEQELIDSAINEAALCTEILLRNGLIKATNRLNSFKGKK